MHVTVVIGRKTTGLQTHRRERVDADEEADIIEVAQGPYRRVSRVVRAAVRRRRVLSEGHVQFDGRALCQRVGKDRCAHDVGASLVNLFNLWQRLFEPFDAVVQGQECRLRGYSDLRLHLCTWK